MTNLLIKDESQPGHHVSYTNRTHGTIQAVCSCGGRWVHYQGDTEKYRHEIFVSHLKYFERPAMTVL